MIRHIGILSVLALALAGCATAPAGNNADGSYSGAYNDGYYAPASNGNGDYYYDRPVVVVNEFDTGFYGGYGFGYWGFGYNPWFPRPWWGYGNWCGWGCGWNHGLPPHSWPHVLPAHDAAEPANAHGGTHGHGQHFGSHVPSH